MNEQKQLEAEKSTVPTLQLQQLHEPDDAFEG